jgi:hypothetical protein
VFFEIRGNIKDIQPFAVGSGIREIQKLVLPAEIQRALRLAS